jgi:hypothetical protein
MSTDTKPYSGESLTASVIQIAQGQVGQQEDPKGTNRGPMIDQYLASVGLVPGYSWCQAFVHWCYEQAAIQHNQTNPVVKTAGVLDCWNRTAVQFKITKTEALQHPGLLTPGCQFIISYGGGAGHTGIIVQIEGDVLHTIEGNSNKNGGREGYEVVTHCRGIDDRSILGFIKY